MDVKKIECKYISLTYVHFIQTVKHFVFSKVPSKDLAAVPFSVSNVQRHAASVKCNPYQLADFWLKMCFYLWFLTHWKMLNYNCSVHLFWALSLILLRTSQV